MPFYDYTESCWLHMSVPVSLRRVGLTGVMCSQLSLRSVMGTDIEVKHSCSTCHWMAYTIVYSSIWEDALIPANNMFDSQQHVELNIADICNVAG